MHPSVQARNNIQAPNTQCVPVGDLITLLASLCDGATLSSRPRADAATGQCAHGHADHAADAAVGHLSIIYYLLFNLRHDRAGSHRSVLCTW